METKDNLTNETLGTKFKSQFDLVNYAIRYVDRYIKSGRAPRVIKFEIQNPAALVLEEIRQGKDEYEDAFEEVKTIPFEEKDFEEANAQRLERKRNRRFS
ncbi:hypothetical protein PHSC3_002064 [Chlamydiales bacterium STE3]|nr:hypothetical protein PHSC3_002064 [Chlamydiales bacterium STE3]